MPDRCGMKETGRVRNNGHEKENLKEVLRGTSLGFCEVDQEKIRKKGH